MSGPHAPAVRLVSLCPSITETLIDFGRADALVGITRFCIHPAEVVATIRKVGGTKDPDIEAIAALEPDLVFVNEEENRKEDFDALIAHGLTVDATMTRTVDEVPEQLRHFGRLVKAEGQPEARAVELEAGLEALASNTLQTAPFRYAYLIWRKPWMAVGAETYVDDLMTRAGGRNVFGDRPDRYPTITVEELAACAPDVVFLPDEPFPFSAKHRPELEGAVPNARLDLVSGDDCCWHGVRSIRGVRLAQTFAR